MFGSTIASSLSLNIFPSTILLRSRNSKKVAVRSEKHGGQFNVVYTHFAQSFRMAKYWWIIDQMRFCNTLTSSINLS